MRRYDIERLRRSLAMSPSLSPDAAAELISNLQRIMDDRQEIESIASELERVAAELRRLST